MVEGFEHSIGEILQMATAQLVQGTVLFAAPKEPYQTQNGPRINVKVKLGDHQEVKLWDNSGGPLQGLRKGQPVTLIYDGKTYKLVESEATQNSQEPAPPGQPIPDARKVEIAQYVSTMANLYAFCFSESKRALGTAQEEVTTQEGVTEETIRCAASSLFITAQKRFSL